MKRTSTVLGSRQRGPESVPGGLGGILHLAWRFSTVRTQTYIGPWCERGYSFNWRERTREEEWEGGSGGEPEGGSGGGWGWGVGLGLNLENFILQGL